VLQEVEWYRVVLDEGIQPQANFIWCFLTPANISQAHWIRNKSSHQFRAAESLKSDRRWCLSGTPIQNRLNDLESLLGFLHFQPFLRTSVFQKYILEPLSKDTPDHAKNLRALLSGLCLRRGGKYLGLSDPTVEEIRVGLTAAERSLYDDTLRRCASDLDDVVSKKSKAKKYAVLFAAITRLRRICNHGVISTSTDTSETECVYCNRSDDENLALEAGDVCDKCGRLLIEETRSPGLRSPLNENTAGTPSQWQGAHGVTQTSLAYQPSTTSNFTAYSSKLLTVAKNLESTPPGSRRLVHRLRKDVQATPNVS